MAFVCDDASGPARMWVDGNLTMDKQLSTADAENNVTTYAGFWDKLNNCLANAGIPGWVITAITIACAAVCVGTVGLGCVWAASRQPRASGAARSAIASTRPRNRKWST